MKPSKGGDIRSIKAIIKALPFEIKILAILVTFLVLVISMINYIHIATLKELVMESVEKDINFFASNQAQKRDDYIFAYEEYQRSEQLIFIKKINNQYFFIKKDFIYQKLKYRINILLMWEAVLLVSVIIIYYFTAHRLIGNRERYVNLIEVFSLVLNHKLRNFISIVKFNATDLPDKKNMRLQNASLKLENDVTLFNNLITLFKKDINVNKPIKVIITEIVEELNNFFDKRVKLNLSDHRYMLPIDDAYFTVYILTENALKYSKEHLEIKSIKFRRYYYLALKNDINPDTPAGLGIGLKTVEKLCKKHNWQFKYRKNKDYFVVIIRFTKSLLTF
ncbi:MAG: hypothetical protein LDL13_07690 [Calditerrivibrio sp.]|nr:hypothetical protein [Calditerrivibrio sp.]MCA1933443.1 hypothetical protein [Calditerrivibrio sp.]MCA1980720.1 hypothetical protein [Calditerrivibrio sp.]